MIGFYVLHSHQKLGRIIDLDPRLMKVYFYESNAAHLFDADALKDGTLRRCALPLGTLCEREDKEVTIERFHKAPSHHEPNEYDVIETDTKLRTRVPETELAFIEAAIQRDPLGIIKSLNQGGYPLYRAREELISAEYRLFRKSGGLRALLSSRIDLRPHQAYVAGRILLDGQKRYLLADEVGLGKTIEAGIVIHDLLIKAPQAKVLIVCPGALSQQWLCELYSKFGGHIFKLLDLYADPVAQIGACQKVIASFAEASTTYASKLQDVTWDMVVIDETHHLLYSQALYETALNLSQSTSSLLLLSAIPAQRREDEFLRLLRLLEPTKYTPDVVADSDRFQSLFQLQPEIGRKIRLVRRRLDGLKSGKFSHEDLQQKISDLLSLPLLNEDKQLADQRDLLDPSSRSFSDDVERLIYHVGEYYRIDRRIFRNRRERLIEEAQIVAIERRATLRPYDMEQLEYETLQATNDLIESAVSNGAGAELVHPLACVLWHGLVHPSSFCDLLGELIATAPREIDTQDSELLNLGYLGGHAEWSDYLDIVFGCARTYIEKQMLQELATRALRWQKSQATYSRLSGLLQSIKAIKRRIGGDHAPRILIFAGFPGVAALLQKELEEVFGATAVTSFLTDLSRDQKERNVEQFRSNDATFLMVCDESGGEGRNFQFADCIVHFDTPWHASKVEQRIGRLDRLGRENASTQDVYSDIIFAADSIENGLVHNYHEGLGVYQKSISGLEFALRDVEMRIVETAVESGYSGLMEISQEVQRLAVEERERDESEALLDEGSFNAGTAEKYRRVRNSEESEVEIATAFTTFLKMIGTGKSARRIDDDIWELRGGEIFQIRGDFGDGLIDPKTAYRGTFKRAIAQQRFELDFFNVGHPLFNLIIGALTSEPVGRTYAVELTDIDADRWIGWEFVFNAVPSLDLLQSSQDLRDQAQELFMFHPQHILIDDEGNLATDPGELVRVRRSICRENKGVGWTNLTKTRAFKLQDHFESPSWPDAVQAAYDAAATQARNQFAEEVDARSFQLSKEVGEQLRQLHTPADDTEINRLLRFRAAIQEWTVQLDSVGFLSINGGLAGKK